MSQESDDDALATISLFVSSPGDVLPERDAVTRVVQRLNDEQHALLKIKDIRWENAYFGAHADFQSQIIEAEGCNLVVCIFWRRLGSELPPDFPKKMKNGRPFPSGTVYEMMTALEAHEMQATPDVWVYKKTKAVADVLQGPEEMAQRLSQWQALEDFWKEFFVNARGQFVAAYTQFGASDQFEALFEKHLRSWLADKGLLKERLSWRLKEQGSPFRGLRVFDVEHERIMFGRERLAGRALETLRRSLATNSAFILLVGDSGSGKSSFARAALLPRILRLTGEGPDRADIWRLARLTLAVGEDPFDALARALFTSEALPELAKSDFSQPLSLAEAMRKSVTTGVAPIAGVLSRVAKAFKTDQNFDRPATARLALLVDQLECLFTVAPEDQAGFAILLRELVATGLCAVVATLRADRYDAFVRVNTLLALKEAGGMIDVPIPGVAEIGDIVRKPAEASGIAFGVDAATGKGLDEILIAATAGRDALPLLQFTLQKLYEGMLGRLAASAKGLASAAPEDLVLQPQDYFALGGLEGAIGIVADNAFRQLDREAQAALPRLVRALVLGSDRTFVSATALEQEVVKDEPMARLVEALEASRILIAGQRSGADGKLQSTIHFTHEAVLRGWQAARERLVVDGAFYRIRQEVADAGRRWRESGMPDDRLIPPGLQLSEASQLAREYRDELDPEIVAYVDASIRHEAASRGKSRRYRVLAAAIAAVATAGLAYAVWTQKTLLIAYIHLLVDDVRPRVLAVSAEKDLRPGDAFQECMDCPEMIVIPAGAFKMGSSSSEAHDMDPEHKDYTYERPVHEVTIAQPFAVSKFDITFEQWDVCYQLGGCEHLPSDEDWGRGKRPVINVDWKDAKEYVAWLSKRTGEPYRLLTEAEFEYSARAGSTTAFDWGDAVGDNHADCDGCESRWDNLRTAEVGSFPPNSFGLYDMHGNVWQFVEDCFKENYDGAPTDGSPVVAATCQRHVVRGGSWYNYPVNIRSAIRYWYVPGSQKVGAFVNTRADAVGFRVARALANAAR